MSGIKESDVRGSFGGRPSGLATVPTNELQLTVAEFRAGLESGEIERQGFSRGLTERAIVDCQGELDRRKEAGTFIAAEVGLATVCSEALLPAVPFEEIREAGTSEVEDRKEESEDRAELKVQGTELSLSEMRPELLTIEIAEGRIEPPVGRGVGFMVAGLRIPTASGAVEAVSLDVETNDKLGEARRATFALVEEGEARAEEQPKAGSLSPRSIDIELNNPIGDPGYLPIPFGSTVVEYAGDEQLALPTPGAPGVLVEGGYEDAAYHLRRGLSEERVSGELYQLLMPTQQEMRFWQRVLDFPEDLRLAIGERLRSSDPLARDEVFELITGYLAERDSDGRSRFSYVCHPAVGEFLRGLGADLPLAISELNVGHCDYLAWYSCAALRAFGIPAWMTSEYFPTKAGTAFNVACGHARVVALKGSLGREVLFDLCDYADLAPGWLPEVLPTEQVKGWGERLKGVESVAQKREIFREIKAEVQALGESEKAKRALKDFQGALAGGIFAAAGMGEGLAALLGSERDKVQAAELGILVQQPFAPSSLKAVQDQSAIERLRELGECIRDAISDGARRDLNKLMSSDGVTSGSSAFMREAVAECLDILKYLKRSFFDYEEVERHLVYSGKYPDTAIDVFKEEGFTEIAQAPTYIHRSRDAYSADLRLIAPASGDRNDLMEYALLCGGVAPEVYTELSQTVISDYPLAHIDFGSADLEPDRLRATIDTLKRIELQGWDYRHKCDRSGRYSYDICGPAADESGLGLGKIFEENALILWGLCNFEINLQKALVSGSRVELQRFKQLYELSEQEYQKVLNSRDWAYFEGIRPIFPELDVSGFKEMEARRNFTGSGSLGDIWRHYKIDGFCKTRLRQQFDQHLKGFSKKWLDQKVWERGELRDYQAGDDVRYIDWKVSARRSGLMVRLGLERADSMEDALVVALSSYNSDARSALQELELVECCKELVKRSERTVLLTTLWGDHYFPLDQQSCRAPAELLLKQVYSSKAPSAAGATSNRGLLLPGGIAPKNLLLVGDNFGDLVVQRELLKGIDNLKVLWLQHRDFDVFPIMRGERRPLK